MKLILFKSVKYSTFVVRVFFVFVRVFSRFCTYEKTRFTDSDSDFGQLRSTDSDPDSDSPKADRFGTLIFWNVKIGLREVLLTISSYSYSLIYSYLFLITCCFAKHGRD